MTDLTAYIRQLEFQLEKAERGMGMPYSRDDVAHYRRLIAEARRAQFADEMWMPPVLPVDEDRASLDDAARYEERESGVQS